MNMPACLLESPLLLQCSSQDAATFQGLWISLFMNVGCLVEDQEQWRLEIRKKQPTKQRTKHCELEKCFDTQVLKKSK